MLKFQTTLKIELENFLFTFTSSNEIPHFERKCSFGESVWCPALKQVKPIKRILHFQRWNICGDREWQGDKEPSSYQKCKAWWWRKLYLQTFNLQISLSQTICSWRLVFENNLYWGIMTALRSLHNKQIFDKNLANEVNLWLLWPITIIQRINQIFQ